MFKGRFVHNFVEVGQASILAAPVYRITFKAVVNLVINTTKYLQAHVNCNAKPIDEGAVKCGLRLS
jgi:hypothetical protein